MLALFRIVELEEGNIFIDGVDIAKIGLNLLRNAIAIVPQEPVLFKGDVKSNLDPFDNCTEQEIIAALKQVHLYDRVFAVSEKSSMRERKGADGGGERKKLESPPSDQIVTPCGLLTPVEFGGVNFSVGERHLFCLARAILKKAKILVLDECSANIDPETDRLLQETIRDAFREATVLCVAHRIETIIGMDSVMVLKEGRLIEFGGVNELRAKVGGEFRSLCERAGIT